MVREIKDFIIKYLLALVLTVLLIVPVLATLFSWLIKTGERGVFTYLNKEAFILIVKSMLLSSLVALFATAIGTACGFILHKIRIKGSGIYSILLLIPLLVSPYIFAVAWKDIWVILMGNASPVNSFAGVIMVHTLIYFPLAILITGNALTNIHSGIEDAGLLVTSFRRMVFRILLPLIRPVISTSYILILIFSLSDFSVPAFFGVRTFTVELFTQFSAFYNHDAAIAQALLLVFLCLVLILSESRYLSSAPFFAVDVKGNLSRTYSLSKNAFIVHLIFLLLIVIAVVMPVCMLLIQSLSGKQNEFLHAFQLLKPAVFQSLKMALSGAVIITLIGLLAAHLQERNHSSMSNWILLGTFILPSTVLGIAFIKFYNQPATAIIYATMLIVLIGYLGKFGFIISRIMGNGFKQLPRSLEEAAAIAGSNSFRRFFKILLPLLFPSLFTGFVLAFVLCLGELGISIMVYPPGTELMPVKIFTISANASQSLTSSMTLISFSVTIFFLVLFYIGGKVLFKKYRYV